MDSRSRKPRLRPTPAFWLKVGLACTFIAGVLPAWAAIALAVGFLLLPARWFEP